MLIHRFLFLGLLLNLIAACRESDAPEPPAPNTFDLYVQNEFDALDAHYAVFLSDKEGIVRAFRWLPPKDTAIVSVPDVQSGERFDCTVVKVTAIQVSGSNAPDTTVTLRTYTNLDDGAQLRLHDPNFQQTTDLHIAFTGMTSLDSIVVPDGLTFARPQPGNNFQGQYRVFHSGRVWCRLRIDGETNWRYAYFDNVGGPVFQTGAVATMLPALTTPPTPVGLPFLAAWDFQVDRVIDATGLQFLPVGNPIRIPGGAVPILDRLDLFEPPGLPAAGYRLRVSGVDDTPGGYGYTCDRFYDVLPAALPEPSFDIQPTLLADNRLVAVQCTGTFDILCFTRTGAGLSNMQWEVYTAPSNTGFVTYRLPDVPAELDKLFPRLKKYDFNGNVRVRAEEYDQFNAYPDVLPSLLLDDPLWQARAGYLARERVF